MSLLDVSNSDEDVSAESGSSRGSSGSDSPLLPPPPPPPSKRDGAAAVAGGPGRNTLTEADVRQAAAQRREQLAQRLRYRGTALVRGLAGAPAPTHSVLSPAPVGAAKAGAEEKNSVFGNSIAAALQLRKAEQEKLLLRRIAKERESDAKDATLVEKDMEVGVFVTTAYRQLLRRHRKGSSDAAEGAQEDAGRRKEGSDEDDGDDPLEAYIRKLEKEKQRRTTSAPDTAPADKRERGEEGSNSSGGGPSADFYDNMMLEGLRVEQKRQQEDTAQKGAEAPPAEAPPPSVEELQSLLLQQGKPLSPTTTSLPDPSRGETDQGTLAPAAAQPPQPSKPAAQRAREEQERFLHAARESRKRRRADTAFIESCAMRAEERMARSLGITG